MSETWIVGPAATRAAPSRRDDIHDPLARLGSGQGRPAGSGTGAPLPQRAELGALLVSQHRLVRALTVIPPRVRRIGAPVLAAAILVGGGFGIMHGHHGTPTPTAVRTDDRASRGEARSAASPDPTTPAPTTPAAPPAPSTPAA